jgi:dTDP-4-dehydrorhamnose 3,5-epimerase
MKLVETPIKDLFVLEPTVFSDDRGYFCESYNESTFEKLGISTKFVQDNHSFSKAGVLRGLHFQRQPRAQAKLVRCTSGRLWDVAVDIRKKSPTYGQSFGIELSAENCKMLYIPIGFLHGFYALEDCELQYKCSDTYSPEHDGSIIYNDTDLNIAWPLIGAPILSNKDLSAPSLIEANLDF